MDPRDYIDDDEGRDFPQEETEVLKCGSCGQPAPELTRCVWDADLMVGACCENYTDHRCPDCGSDNLRFAEYDHGRESETGYHDAGVRAICQDCGCECESRETRVTIGPVKSTTPASIPWMVSRKPATPAAGIASIGPGLYVRTAPRKGGRR